MTKILLIASNIHKQLASKQLEKCLELVKHSAHDYTVVQMEAGSYEIPFVINHYQAENPYDGYIALGLVLNTNKDHYAYIMDHIKTCFSHFAMNRIVVGNGIISATTIEELSDKINSPDPCLSAYPSAFRSVDCLIQLQAEAKYRFP